MVDLAQIANLMMYFPLTEDGHKWMFLDSLIRLTRSSLSLLEACGALKRSRVIWVGRRATQQRIPLVIRPFISEPNVIQLGGAPTNLKPEANQAHCDWMCDLISRIGQNQLLEILGQFYVLSVGADSISTKHTDDSTILIGYLGYMSEPR